MFCQNCSVRAMPEDVIMIGWFSLIYWNEVGFYAVMLQRFQTMITVSVTTDIWKNTAWNAKPRRADCHVSRVSRAGNRFRKFIRHLVAKTETQNEIYTGKKKNTELNATVETNKPKEGIQEQPVYLATVRLQSGDRLTYLAKKYYGHKDFWVYIYEANKAVIKKPDILPIGTTIKIPKLDASLIDANNPACLKKAREMHDEYLQKTK